MSCASCKFFADFPVSIFAGSAAPINCAVNPGGSFNNCFDWEEEEFIPTIGSFLMSEAPDGELMLLELDSDEEVIFSWIRDSLSQTAIWWLKKHNNDVVNQWLELVS